MKGHETELNAAALALLKAPFKESEYGAVGGTNMYVRKPAIKDRLNEIDPGWTISEPVFVGRDGDVVFMSATLTVCGVSRGGLGSGIIQTARKITDKAGNEEWIAVEGFELAREITKAYKGAASDCLSRAAVWFGVGEDLHEKPNTDKAANTINRFLNRQPPSTPQQSSGSQPPARNGKFEDLRNEDVARRFIQRWRGQSLTNADVLAALGVSRLGEWTKGKAAADEAVNAYITAKLAQAEA